MPEDTKKTDPTPDPKPAAAAPPDADAIRAAERGRITGIQDAVRVAKLGPEFAAELVGRNVTLDQARAEIFAKMAELDKAAPPTHGHRGLEMGEDVRAKWHRGALAWLLQRSGMASIVAAATKTQPENPGEFRGLRLLDLARQALEREGVAVRGLLPMELIGRALTYRTAGFQTTSDFAVLLESAMHKVLQSAYDVTPSTWKRFCGTRNASDFRAQPMYRAGFFGTLDALNEQGEFKSKAIADGEKSTVTVGTKGNIIGLTRQAMVNDDMGAFNDMGFKAGQAAALSVETDVYALLALNGGLGPTQTDSQPFFHSNRKNVNSTGSALAVAGIEADRVVMAAQTDPSGNQILNLKPTILLVQSGLGGTARVINESQYDPDTANKLQRPNMVRGLFSDVVDSPMIVAGSTRRYLFADPLMAAAIVVAFLDGQQSPVMETQNGWRMDGVEWKVRLDYGVAASDPRGAVTNAGA